jgi:hypothetical protein
MVNPEENFPRGPSPVHERAPGRARSQLRKRSGFHSLRLWIVEGLEGNHRGIEPPGDVHLPATLHVIRYADVLLILAEALAEQDDLGGAVAYMNQVRNRAGLDGYVMGTDLATKQDVLDAIFLERRLELAFEGEYWFDLVRTGRAADALGSKWAAHKALWPIPQGEMDTAPNLTQNPGY